MSYFIFLYFRNDLSKNYQVSKLNKDSSNEDMYLDCLLARNKLTETLADLDDEVANYVLENDSLEDCPNILLKEAVKRCTINQARFSFKYHSYSFPKKILTIATKY